MAAFGLPGYHCQIAGFGSVNMFLLKNMKEFCISQYKFHLENYEDIFYSDTDRLFDYYKHLRGEVSFYSKLTY